MKIRIERKELLKAINVIESALPTKTVIDSLKGIKIEAINNSIKFTTSKQDLAICYTVKENFEIESEGIIIIPGFHLITIVRKTEEDYFTIEKVENNSILKTNKSKINLLDYDKSSYPEIDFSKENLKNIVIDKKILKDSYNKVKYSVSNSNIKPILTGINYKINNDSLKVSSTDARRLSLTTFDFITNTEGEFTIFRPLLGILIKILEFTEHKEINLFYNSNQIIIEDGDTILKARLIEGNYPDITRLVPNEFKFSFNVDARKIYSILEKITILSDRDNGNVTLEIKDSQLIVKSYFKELGAIEEICNIDSLNGNPFNISFDPRFLMDSINSIGEDNINLGFVDEISPFKIVGLDKTDNIQIISPIRMT